MAVGRISGPLLKANLLRDGVDLAFETNLLYLDVNNGRIGIKTSTPTDELQVNGTTRTTNLKVDTQADIGTGGNKFTVTGNVISSTNSVISLEPTGTNPVVYQNKLQVGDLIASGNIIESLTDINFNTGGSGNVNIYANVLVNGDVHATGNITADGDIVIGDSNTDSIAFNADIISNLIPDVTNTYSLGSTAKKWKDIYVNNVYASGVTTGDIVVGGVNLILPQGNTIYVATTGADDNSGTHEHDPFRTIGRACEVATAGTTIFIYPGQYEEIFPIEVPAGVTVHGSSLRSVLVKPTAATMFLDAFHMNGEATVEDITITGFHHDPLGSVPEFPINNQGTGHAFRFSWGSSVTGRSPYVRNITVITFGTASVLAIASQKTQTIAGLTRIKNIIDELVVNGSITKTPANPLNPNTSLTASNGTTGTLLQGLIDDVIYVINNGTLKSDLPTINANGTATTTGVLYNAAVILAANKEFLKQEITAYVTATYPAPGFVYDIATCQRDMGYIVDALIYDITRGGNEHSVYAGIAHWVQPTNDPRGYARADAGHGALVDGGAVASTSKEAAMLFHSVTFLTPAADTLIATNGARIEWLNSFTYFAGRGLYAYSSPEGFAQAGLTRLRINTRTGTWAVGNTLNYYDTDGTTVLGTGVIASIEDNFVNLTGRCLGFETITDRTPTTIYVNGNAKLSTAQKKFGASSLLLDGTSDYISHPTAPDFAFGTGAFCVEMWVYRTGGSGAIQVLADFRSATPQVVPTLYLSATNYYPSLVVNGAIVIAGTTTVPLNTWTHIAVAKSGTSTKIFMNGSQQGSTYTDTNNYIQGPLTIGARFDGTTAFYGYLDDVKVSKGVARYTTTFTPPTSALTGDLSTVLLLHFNGNNNSTTILDDGITFQDLRTSAGGTGTIINFADYSDFGAEIRAIGSANVYGDYGAYGDGVGVIAYLVSQNFAYVGSGKVLTNDPNDRIGANEVVELNGAHIYRTSVDNEGNFQVGNSFYVNQKTGEVLFDSQNLTVTSATGVEFTDGVHTTTITPTYLTTGNITIHDNNIDSLIGDINVTAASGAINLQSNTFVTGNLDVTGDVNIGGNITIGDASTDTVSFVAGINSNLVPATTATYDLGTTSLRWNNAYLSRLEVDGLVIDNNTVSTTVGNDDLILTANGAGKISIPSNDVLINQNLTVTQDLTVTTGTTYLRDTTIVGTMSYTGDIIQTGDTTITGSYDVTGHITSTGYLQLPQVRIENNVISTTGVDLELQANGAGNVVIEGIKISDNNIQSVATNSNITLTPQGTGSVVINSNQSLQIPVGTTAQRPGTLAGTTATTGMVRYNTDLAQYEGYNGTYWIKLSGVQDLDGNTYIKAESTLGANDNTLYFYANNNLMVTIDATKMFAERLQTSNLDLNGNTISSITTDSNLNLTANGTGAVRVGNLRISNNTITNISNNAVTEFNETGNGYFKIAGTNGFVIPSGDGYLQRPLIPEIGMTRFNIDGQLVEVYNGVTWGSVAGASGGVTSVEAGDIGILSAIIYG